MERREGQALFQVVPEASPGRTPGPLQWPRPRARWGVPASTDRSGERFTPPELLYLEERLIQTMEIASLKSRLPCPSLSETGLLR